MAKSLTVDTDSFTNFVNKKIKSLYPNTENKLNKHLSINYNNSNMNLNVAKVNNTQFTLKDFKQGQKNKINHFNSINFGSLQDIDKIILGNDPLQFNQPKKAFKRYATMQDEDFMH
eukprot:CAMPEP_0116935986 /NCGR_PEP_ID=MMETSP0467-20121206/30613_1 /TAXON_ID=283647 /ORGANISM="Mesodinium pulex, Strain SPMC105" /LENGTH=115 /DNA_ID=CAMNT_0004617471 /DNA_START=251 /DNA_END=598 /DNA_ORIENTATION=+